MDTSHSYANLSRIEDSNDESFSKNSTDPIDNSIDASDVTETHDDNMDTQGFDNEFKPIDFQALL